ncbi:hypothetical protein PR048_015715 [Dryococelus australis]|uniref:Uncharacterized protein n=1 Tax=Dryococelus australis TaxID=614101 RepID=A0ABQ9HHP4_9NEOP|nr:hypothetical protein PR048_015715 [Dryococelus australis]
MPGDDAAGLRDVHFQYPCIPVLLRTHLNPPSVALKFGAAVAERLARSPPTKASRVQSPAGSPDFCKWDSCRTMLLVGVFSQGSPVSPAPSFRRHSIFTSHPHLLSRLRISSLHFISLHFASFFSTVAMTMASQASHMSAQPPPLVRVTGAPSLGCLGVHWLASLGEGLPLRAEWRKHSFSGVMSLAGLEKGGRRRDILKEPSSGGYMYTKEWGPVAEQLDCSPPTKENWVQSPAWPRPDLRKLESCRTSPLVCGFSRGSSVLPVLAFRPAPFSPHFTLIHDEVRAVLIAHAVRGGGEVRQAVCGCSLEAPGEVIDHAHNHLGYGSLVSAGYSSSQVWWHPCMGLFMWNKVGPVVLIPLSLTDDRSCAPISATTAPCKRPVHAAR